MINNRPAKPRAPETEKAFTSQPSSFLLWSPYEAAFICVLIVFVFAFFLAGEKYELIAQMFAPVGVVAIVGLALQIAFAALSKD